MKESQFENLYIEQLPENELLDKEIENSINAFIAFVHNPNSELCYSYVNGDYFQLDKGKDTLFIIDNSDCCDSDDVEIFGIKLGDSDKFELEYDTYDHEEGPCWYAASEIPKAIADFMKGNFKFKQLS